MAKKSIWTTLAGLAIAGAAVGGAVAYLKKCKEVNDLDYLDEESSSCGCSAERTYTTLPTENPQKEETAGAEDGAEEPEDKPEAADSQDDAAQEPSQEPDDTPDSASQQ